MPPQSSPAVCKRNPVVADHGGGNLRHCRSRIVTTYQAGRQRTSPYCSLHWETLASTRDAKTWPDSRYLRTSSAS